MTRDEVLAMPAGRELDSLVAEKVLGMPSATLKDTRLCPYCDQEMWGGLYRKWCTTCHEWRYSSYKEYSDDIAAAWQLVEKHSYYFDLTRTNDSGLRAYPIGNVHWECRFYAPNRFQAIADTAPLAICRAAILAAWDEFISENEAPPPPPPHVPERGG